MDIRDIEDLSMPFRSGKYQGQTIRSVLLKDRNYVMWVAREREEMLKPHRPDPKYKSPFRDSELSESYHTSPKKSYGNSWSRPQVPQREWTLEEIQARTFPEVPDTGMSRYDLRSPSSWGAPAGETEEED
jgi:hypothetical protein